MEIINYKNKTSGASTPEGFQVYKKIPSVEKSGAWGFIALSAKKSPHTPDS